MFVDHINVYIGIDPGANGGFAVMTGGPVAHLVTDSMPKTIRGIWTWINSERPKEAEWVGGGLMGDYLIPGTRPFAVVELVGGYVGGFGQPGSYMFNFGRVTGAVLASLEAAGIPYAEVHPNVWQRAIGIEPRGKKEKKGAFKNRLKARAVELFPDQKVTLKTCDALLLCYYCRMTKDSR